jgi:curved DNA-binding protein CbpA
MDRLKLIEKEMTRLGKLSKILTQTNPLLIFDLDNNFKGTDLKKSYYKISRLIHPDKNNGQKRFVDMFAIMSKCNSLLLDNDSKKLCIGAKKREDGTVLEKLWISDEIINDNQTAIKTVNKNIDEKLNRWAIETFAPHQLQIYTIQELIHMYPDKLSIDINIHASEHTKNKSKSKSDKHQKGLRQRKTMINNAERRIKNHQFSFTSNVTINKNISE